LEKGGCGLAEDTVLTFTWTYCGNLQRTSVRITDNSGEDVHRLPAKETFRAVVYLVISHSAV